MTAATHSPISTKANQFSRFSWQPSRINQADDWFTRWFIDWWALEIISWLFSAICIAIIIIVLSRTDGKPLPNWSLGISIKLVSHVIVSRLASLMLSQCLHLHFLGFRKISAPPAHGGSSRATQVELVYRQT
jgi:hypothetical protein